MSYRNGKPCCDMKEDCQAPIAYIDIKGFIYCESHGIQRKRYVSCRKLKASEIKLIEAGQPTKWKVG